MIVIYHNPDCGTSRNVLKVLQDAGSDPVVVHYLEEGWTKAQLLGLFAAADLTPRSALRVSKSPAEQLGLLREDITDAELLDAMVEHPVLVNRPFVCSPLGTRLCRPSDAVLDLIETWPVGPYYKEDGSLMIDAEGQRAS
ncbi:MAG: arsenate reductase (glutaredoxin) [Parvularcula sp.]|nr:arsenate reductase (glutaredoxin) [Parvularcula sp.]